MTRLVCTMLALALGAPPVIAQNAPSYAKSVQPIFNKYCVECHNTDKMKGNVNLESYDSVMRGRGGKKKMVIPGDPDNSRLIKLMDGKTKPPMPPERYTQPEAKEIEILRAWIKAGAKNDPPPKEPEHGTQSKRALLIETPKSDSAVVRRKTGGAAHIVCAPPRFHKAISSIWL